MRKIALVGTAKSGEDAPFKDESWEIWGVATRADYVTRANRWFELHRIEGEGERWAKTWRESLKKFTHDVELLMFYPEPDLGPSVGHYPIDRISARFGTYFMTSSFAWMMALAIDELRPIEDPPVDGMIGLFGVEMEYGTEYREQRVGLRHFIDLARVMGIGINRSVAGGLAYEPVPYPLWQDDPFQNKLEARSKEIDDTLKTHDKSINHTRTMIAQNQAVIEALEKFGGPVTEIARLEEETHALMQTSSNLSKAIVGAEAVREEQQYWKDYISP